MTNIEDIESIDFRKVADRVFIPRDIFDMPREKGKSDNTPWLTREAFEPYIDEDLNGDDGSIIEATKITSQSLSTKKDTSRGAREN
ncbi:MAG: hypothetical protein IJ440_00590 [Alphaproteobacteria bacterium]|nr:hypothetical protein [Alphaproteobacteria bacterium]